MFGWIRRRAAKGDVDVLEAQRLIKEARLHTKKAQREIKRADKYLEQAGQMKDVQHAMENGG